MTDSTRRRRAPRAGARGPARRRSHPGDGWVECRCGRRHWGLNGAAGLLVWRSPRSGPDIEVLLQLRAEWTHHGGTWGLPGGAVADGESAAEAALRECEEETGLPARALLLEPGPGHVQAHPDWSYTTFTARAPSDAAWDALVPLDGESTVLRWVRLQPSPDGAAWEPPSPGGTRSEDEADRTPLLPALRTVWSEVAAHLPHPSHG